MQTFDEDFKKSLESPKSIIIFKGSVDATTGENWCSDCVKAEPFIEKFLKPQASEQNIPVLIVDVGARDDWVNKEHKMRKHPKFRLQGVPTICFIEEGQVVKQLKEEQCFDEQFINSLFD